MLRAGGIEQQLLRTPGAVLQRRRMWDTGDMGDVSEEALLDEHAFEPSLVKKS